MNYKECDKKKNIPLGTRLVEYCGKYQIDFKKAIELREKKGWCPICGNFPHHLVDCSLLQHLQFKRMTMKEFKRKLQGLIVNCEKWELFKVSEKIVDVITELKKNKVEKPQVFGRGY
jgi:hypothetical protein